MNWTKLYDETRVPAHWTDLMRPGQHAVFLFEVGSHAPRGQGGRTFAPDEGGSVALCENLDEALAFAGETVAAQPRICCDVYDYKGKSGDPIAVIYNERVRPRYQGLQHAKRQSAGGVILLFCGACFAAYDATRDLAWIWGTSLGSISWCWEQRCWRAG